MYELNKSMIIDDIEKIKENFDNLKGCINFYKYVWVNISEEERQRLIKEYKEVDPENKIFDPLN